MLVAQMLVLNHEVLLISPRVCRMALERQNFRLEGRVARFLDGLRNKAVGVGQVMSFCVGLLRETATTVGGRDHLPTLTLALADIAVANRNRDEVLYLFESVIRQAFLLLPEEKDIVLGCLARYSQRRPGPDT